MGSGMGSGEGDDKHASFWGRWRRNFLTGLVLVLPLYLTAWITWSFIGWVDGKVENLIPGDYALSGWLSFPGYGLLFFVLVTAMIGAVAKNFFAAQIIRWGEGVLDRLPIVRSIYTGVKQIAETIFVQSGNSFQKACLLEYPRKGVWAIGFIATSARGEIARRTERDDLVSVFMPTTPNPTTGFLMFVPRDEIHELDMTIEEAAKMLISAGLVTPGDARAEAPRLPAAAE
jgi:uncharacterized membrane protein